MDKKLLFTGPDHKDNWLYNDWYYDGINYRYHTWQVALNILNQTISDPVIIETGCQRSEDDLGSGMSTSLFCEYISRYGGSLISVDISPQSIAAAIRCTKKYDIKKDCYIMDSVKFLEHYKGKCDLAYLDSYDYPYGQMLDAFGGKTDIDKAQKLLHRKTSEQIHQQFGEIIGPCQKHCLNEAKAILPHMNEKSIILIDDNQFPGGGKSKTAKEFLAEQGWVCLLDLQQSLWIRSI